MVMPGRVFGPRGMSATASQRPAAPFSPLLAGCPVPQEKLRRDDTLELGELDLALFRELGMDGRTSHADLAKAVG